MDFLIIASGLLFIAVLVGVPVYFVFFGMAGRSWKGIKEHDKWKREQRDRENRE